MVKLACPLPLSAVGPARTVLPSRNVTLPTVTGALVLALRTVAVNVTELLGAAVNEGLSEEVTVVVVAGSLVVTKFTHQPVAMLLWVPPAESSTKKSRHVPFGAAPL